MRIPDDAVEAAAKWLPHSGDCKARPERDCTCWQIRVNLMRTALEAAAPHIQQELERELVDAKRMIALLVLEAGGEVTLSRRAISEVSDKTVIETTQDVINGGWVIRARKDAL